MASSHDAVDSSKSDVETNQFVSTRQYGLPKTPHSQRLSLLDMNMPRIYATRWILCFSQPDNVDNVQIYESLREGLAHTIAAIPWLAGNIGTEEGSDPKLNRIQIVEGCEGVVFRQRDYSKTLPSYHDLKHGRFPLALLSTAQLSPVGVMPRSPCVVMAAQANFIRGGLLLTIAMHHSVCDGKGMDLIIEQWASYTAAVARGDKIARHHDPSITDRNALMKGDPGANVNDFPEYILMPTPREVETDVNTHQIAETPFHLPPMTARVFLFSLECLAALKINAACYSTNDALMAFLWTHIARARWPPSSSTTCSNTADQTSALLFATDVRSRTSPPLSPTYLGNASMAVITPRLSASDLSAEDGLKKAAAVIRSSINAFNSPNRAMRVIGLLGSRSDPTDFKFAYNGFLGPDVSATSWAKFGVGSYDWGVLKKPDAFRIPGEGSDGTIVVFPQVEDAGLEVMVGLEDGAMQRLLTNPDFLQVAVPWA